MTHALIRDRTTVDFGAQHGSISVLGLRAMRSRACGTANGHGEYAQRQDHGGPESHSRKCNWFKPSVHHAPVMAAPVVTLVPYDPTWPDLFEAEATRIQRNVHDLLIRLEHVGSTAVPGIAA